MLLLGVILIILFISIPFYLLMKKAISKSIPKDLDLRASSAKQVIKGQPLKGVPAENEGTILPYDSGTTLFSLHKENAVGIPCKETDPVQTEKVAKATSDAKDTTAADESTAQSKAAAWAAVQAEVRAINEREIKEWLEHKFSNPHLYGTATKTSDSNKEVEKSQSVHTTNKLEQKLIVDVYDDWDREVDDELSEEAWAEYVAQQEAESSDNYWVGTKEAEIEWDPEWSVIDSETAAILEEEAFRLASIEKFAIRLYTDTQYWPFGTLYPNVSKKDIAWLDKASYFTQQSVKHGYPCYAIYTYYPKRYVHVPEDVVHTRQIVYGFKDGRNSKYIAMQVASAFVNTFKEQYQHWTEANTVFVIIPASTKAKTESRYRDFCKLVSAYLGVKDGYEAIQVVQDREVQKGITGVSKIANLGYKPSVFKGRHVLIFDDVKTSGASFTQNAQRLSELGAAKVSGFFLAETYDSYRKGEPSWNVTSVPINDLPF